MTKEEYDKFLEEFDASGDYQDISDTDDYDILEYLEDLEF